MLDIVRDDISVPTNVAVLALVTDSSVVVNELPDNL